MVISTENMMTQFGTPIGQTISLQCLEKALIFTSKLPAELHTWMLHGEYLPSHFQGKI